ncbi:MAG: hypothetical protein F6J87_28795 [Spirulina sp. SIO3F2]|nr:hypothetical protein [Spirulina sp. SIO3F2]
MRLVILMIGLLLGGCSTSIQTSLETNSGLDPSTLTKPQAIAPAAPQSTTSPTPTVRVYRAAPDCNQLVAESVAVPEATLEQAVGAAIAQFETTDFPLAGYRVQRNPKAQAVTIDLRLPPSSPRPLTALSQCEQFALFAGLRQTVMQFEPGQVQTVEFQIQGEAIGG